MVMNPGRNCIWLFFVLAIQQVITGFAFECIHGDSTLPHSPIRLLVTFNEVGSMSELQAAVTEVANLAASRNMVAVAMRDAAVPYAVYRVTDGSGARTKLEGGVQEAMSAIWTPGVCVDLDYVLVPASGSPPPSPPPPPGTTSFVYQNNVYKFYAQQLPWAKAVELCHNEGMEIACFSSLDEFNFVAGIIRSFTLQSDVSRSMWIGYQYAEAGANAICGVNSLPPTFDMPWQANAPRLNDPSMCVVAKIATRRPVIREKKCKFRYSVVCKSTEPV